MVARNPTKSAHFRHSALREKIVEHVFIGEALRALWRQGVLNVEVLRGEFDAHGYDLVVARGNVVRHIQFKTGLGNGPVRVSIPVSLSDKPSGCVIWIQIDHELRMKCFWWFGGEPGKPLPPLGDRQSKRMGRTARGERPMREGHRELRRKQFKRLDTLDMVLEALFGDFVVDECVGRL